MKMTIISGRKACKHYHGGSRMNIYDISRKAGVSIATVSRVLNHNSHVSEETRNRVMNVIQSSGYVPNAFARGLGLNTMKTIGLLCPDASDLYQAQALSILEKLFREKGYDCLLLCTGADPAARKAGAANLTGRHVDGMVLMGSSFIEEDEEKNSYIREAAETMPVALLNGDYDAPGVYCALCEDEQASREAVNAMICMGRRRILHLYHALNFSGRKKLIGYSDALEENGIPYDENLVRLVDKGSQSIKQVAKMLEGMEKEGIHYDAVFCSEDILAIGVLKYARSRGLRIPEDLAVTGYNNSPICLCCEPEMTSVDNRLEDICRHIAKTMMAVLEGEKGEKRKVFPGRLVCRQTTA